MYATIHNGDRKKVIERVSSKFETATNMDELQKGASLRNSRPGVKRKFSLIELSSTADVADSLALNRTLPTFVDDIIDDDVLDVLRPIPTTSSASFVQPKVIKKVCCSSKIWQRRCSFMILGCRNEILQNPFWLILNHSDLIFNTRKKLAKSCGETAIMTQRRADNDGIPQATTKNFDNSNFGSIWLIIFQA